MKKFILLTLLGLLQITKVMAGGTYSTSTFHAGGIYVANSGHYSSTTTVWLPELLVARDIGAKYIRSNWDTADVLHPNATTWNFAPMDWVTQTVKEMGMEVYYTPPWTLQWMSSHTSCLSYNPYTGGATSKTQCPTGDIDAYRVFITSMAIRYASKIHTWELPANEPDFLSASTVTAWAVALTTTAAKAIWTVDPHARIAVPSLAHPRYTVLNGGITAGATTFIGHTWLSQYMGQLNSALADIGPTVTLSSFVVSAHMYPEAAGGNQTYQICMGTISAIMANLGVSAPIIDITEFNAFGGEPASTPYEIQKASAIVKGYAITSSSNTQYSGIGGIKIVHNTNGLKLSITTTTPVAYTPTNSYYVTKRMNELDGYTAMGDQGDGSNVFKFKFVKGNKTVWVAYTLSGTSSWALNPTTHVRMTDMNGDTKLYPASTFSSYPLTNSPIIVEEITENAIYGTTTRGNIQ